MFKRCCIMNAKTLSRAALQAAAIFAVTFFARIPVPALSGAYVNLGDCAIYICAYVFGGLPTVLAAGAGSALADLLAGAAVYVPATAIIKTLMGIIAVTVTKRANFLRFLIASVICGGVMAAGYFLYEALLFGGNYAYVSLPFNLIQWGGTAAVSAVVYPLTSKLKGRSRTL